MKGDVWNHDTPRDSWRITLDPKARPHRIDLVGISPQSGHFRGVYKFEGDTFVYSLRYSEKREADRPRDFDTSGPGGVGERVRAPAALKPARTLWLEVPKKT